MKSIVEIAEQIAREAHDGQVRKCSKEPYVKHSERIAALASTDVMKAAGWLHDVIEDTPWSIAGLLERGISKSVIELVLAVTRRKDETYNQFIQRIRNHSKSAIDLKILDILDNMSDLPDDSSLYRRYEQSLNILRS